MTTNYSNIGVSDRGAANAQMSAFHPYSEQHGAVDCANERSHQEDISSLMLNEQGSLSYCGVLDNHQPKTAEEQVRASVEFLNICTKRMVGKAIAFELPPAIKSFSDAAPLLRTALEGEDIAIRGKELYLSENAVRQLRRYGLNVRLPSQWVERLAQEEPMHYTSPVSSR